MTLFVGTSGWAYKEWRGGFYPEGLPQTRFLDHYGHTLSACEINATFYRLHSEATFGKWAESTPESFRFAAKAHRHLTHGKEIAPDSEGRRFLDAFLQSLEALGPRLGCVLFPFPPYRRRDDGSLGGLLEWLPQGLGYACEFRHDSWGSDEIQERIAAAGGTVCISDTTGAVPDRLPPGPLAYVRLRSARYSADARAGWLALLEREAKSRDVYAFAKHEGAPPGDPLAGVGLAQWLVRQVRGGSAPKPVGDR
jgi:uncharacterized protein YecE (DUF72 family)